MGSKPEFEGVTKTDFKERTVRASKKQAKKTPEQIKAELEKYHTQMFTSARPKKAGE